MPSALPIKAAKAAAIKQSETEVLKIIARTDEFLSLIKRKIARNIIPAMSSI